MSIGNGTPVWTLIAGGDCSFDGAIGEVFKEGQPARIIASPILDRMGSADAVIVNLETPLCSEKRPISKTGPAFISPPQAAKGLRACGIKIASLANNHIMDQGKEGLESTLEVLDAHGIMRLGAGITHQQALKPVSVNIKGSKICFLSFADGEFARSSGNGAGAARLEPIENFLLIQRMAKEHDTVIVSAHAGNEYQMVPSPRIRQCYRRMVEAGAAVVLGHHPHFPQGIETHEGGVIVYSLGNFLFDYQGNQARSGARKSFLCEIRFGAKKALSLTAHPFRKNDDSRIVPIDGEEKERFFEFLHASGVPLGNERLFELIWKQHVVDMFGKLEKKFPCFRYIHEHGSPRRERAVNTSLNLFNSASLVEAIGAAFVFLREGSLADDAEARRYLEETKALLEYGITRKGKRALSWPTRLMKKLKGEDR